MKIISDLSLICCSYNTPEILEIMLKSFLVMHPELGRMNVLIMENSTDDITQHMLDNYKIPYVRNPGGTHSKSLDIAFEKCTTPYALVVDSDIVFQQNIIDLYCLFRQIRSDLAGIECGSRGGYNLKTRIHPWFMFVNIDSIKKNNIKFHDEVRINATNSGGFFGNIPINNVKTDAFLYDVGATFYEDVKNARLKITNLPLVNKYFLHTEGMSWQRTCGHSGYEYRGNKLFELYQILKGKFSRVALNDFYDFTGIDNDTQINEYINAEKQEQLSVRSFGDQIIEFVDQKQIKEALNFYEFNRHYFKKQTDMLKNIDKQIKICTEQFQNPLVHAL
jgi:hypothetical protein